MNDGRTSRRLVWGFVAILAVVHYDWWFWTDTSLWFGFMPVGLGFHALISIFASIAWALVVKFAWPTWIEEWADEGS